MNLQGVSDYQLMAYIDQIFMKYDRDCSGGLDVAQLANFYTDLYRMLGYNVQISYQQAAQAMATIDRNFDGRASKQQLLQAFRIIMGAQNIYTTSIQPIANFQYQQQPMYGQQQMYGQYQGQNPYQQYGQGNMYGQYQGQNPYGQNGQGNMYGQYQGQNPYGQNGPRYY